MNETGSVIWQICLDLLEFGMQAAAALPWLIILALAMGRKGNGAFCLFAALRLGGFAFCLAFAGVFNFLGSYMHAMAGAGNYNLFDTFFSRPAMNYSLSLLLWLSGIFLFYQGWTNLKAAAEGLSFAAGDRYELKIIRFALIFLVLAGFCYFMTFIAMHWPFAGYPENLTRERVIMAILRNAARSWFMALAPAGALACVFAAFNRTRYPDIPREAVSAALRWCAFWAFVGYLPITLQNVGILLGAYANAYKNFAAGYYSQVAGALLIICGMACFISILLRKKTPAWLAWAGLIFYLGAKILPKIIFNTVYKL